MFAAGLLVAILFALSPGHRDPRAPTLLSATNTQLYTRCFGEGCGPRRWRRALNNTSDTIPSTVLPAVHDGVSVQGGDGGLGGSGGPGGNGGHANGGDAIGGDGATLGPSGHCASGTVSVGGHTVVVENGQIDSVDGAVNDGGAGPSGDGSVTQG
ncbi:hypothetical protein C8Q74DRAFT_1366319 [Fomes fomentarius]|nr:hypothetical protein C8Q74DRAFT_1366319 [Fomes fomentarius]